MDGQDPVTYILSANVARRHLSKGQQAMVVVMADALVHSVDNVRVLAEIAGTGKTFARRASVVLRQAPELADQVMAGSVTLNQACRTAQERRQQSRALVENRALLPVAAGDAPQRRRESRSRACAG